MGEYWQVYYAIPNKWLERKARKGQSMYYYYAYIEDGLCVDVERTRKQKTDLTDYVEVSQAEYDACINEETGSENYIIGKKWNGTEWVIPEKFYYAVLDERLIAIDMVDSDEPITKDNYISISKEEYDGKIYLHFRWDVTEEKFKDVSFVEYADTDTTMVSVNKTNTPLQNLLDKIQNDIKNINCEMTPNEILAALLSVDGSGSGIDADLLDGKNSSEFATVAALTTLSNLVNNKADASHGHADYANAIQSLSNAISGKADAGHGHNDLAAAITNISNALIGKSDTNHDHSLASHFDIMVVPGNNDFQSKSHTSYKMKFTPDILFVIPNGATQFMQYVPNAYNNHYILWFLGGIYVKNYNDNVEDGCTIDENGFTLYSNYQDNEYLKVTLNSAENIAIGIKF